MRETRISLPELGLIAGTRGMLGAGLGLLLADRLPADQRNAIYDNVRSEEPDVSSISGKLTQGAADAGFVYITDVTASSGQLKAIQLPAELQPNVEYGAAVVTGANNPEGARKFIDGLLNGDGATALKEAGFKPPPG